MSIFTALDNPAKTMERRGRLVILVLLIMAGALCAPSLNTAAAHLAQPGTSEPGGQNIGSGSPIDPILPVLLSFTMILLAAKLGGELFERIKQPAVLGELVAGVILGNLILINSNWNFFEPLRVERISVHWAVVIDGIARIGVILLLFEVGLESTVAEMRRVGLSSLLVAVVGVIAPFILGYGISALFIREVPAGILAIVPSLSLSNIHMFVGATLCATSVGITARVFKDFGKLNLPEAKIILGAAVIDDVLGLLILAVVSGIVVSSETGSPLSISSIVKIAVIAVGFLAGAIVIGTTIVPRVLSSMAKMHTRGVMIVSAVLFCFILSALANLAGLATIVGAFAAGLILEDVHFKEFNEKRTMHELLQPVTALLVPVFFVLMGIQVRLESFASFGILGIALGLTVVAFLGKQVCGLAVVEKGLDRLTIGVGMVPRGEVGLIFASIGKSLHVVDDSIFSALVVTIMLTTFITPPLLKFSLDRFQRRKET